MTSPVVIRVLRDRIHSNKYWVSPKRKLGTPLIINVRTKRDGLVRTEAEQDLEWITERLPKLGFEEPRVIDSDEPDSSLHDKRSFLTELEAICKNSFNYLDKW